MIEKCENASISRRNLKKNEKGVTKRTKQEKEGWGDGESERKAKKEWKKKCRHAEDVTMKHKTEKFRSRRMYRKKSKTKAKQRQKMKKHRGDWQSVTYLIGRHIRRPVSHFSTGSANKARFRVESSGTRRKRKQMLVDILIRFTQHRCKLQWGQVRAVRVDLR